MPDHAEERPPGKMSGNGVVRRLREEGFFWKVLFLITVGLGLLLLWVAADIFLLAFAGSLAGIFMNGLIRQVRKRLPLPHKLAYLVVVLQPAALAKSRSLRLACIAGSMPFRMLMNWLARSHSRSIAV